MFRIGLCAAAMMLSASAFAEEVSDWDRFQLWNECRPVELFVNFEGDTAKDADDFGVTKRAVEVAVRSRLRAARLYTEDQNKAALSSVLVTVDIFDSAYGTHFEYRKFMRDLATEVASTASSWSTRVIGTHGRDATYVLDTVAQDTDTFIDEYLRVNADACD